MGQHSGGTGGAPVLTHPEVPAGAVDEHGRNLRTPDVNEEETMRSRAERREALARYFAAREEFDAYTERYEQDRDAGYPVPTREEDDLEYQRLNDQLADAAAAAPWWTRLVYR